MSKAIDKYTASRDVLHYLRRDGVEILIYCHAEELTDAIGNVDIEVRLASGGRFSATLFTIANLEALMAKDARTGENASGLYQWAIDMVIMRELSLATVAELVEHLLENETIGEVLMRLDPQM